MSSLVALRETKEVKEILSSSEVDEGKERRSTILRGLRRLSP